MLYLSTETKGIMKLLTKANGMQLLKLGGLVGAGFFLANTLQSNCSYTPSTRRVLEIFPSLEVDMRATDALMSLAELSHFVDRKRIRKVYEIAELMNLFLGEADKYENGTADANKFQLTPTSLYQLSLKIELLILKFGNMNWMTGKNRDTVAENTNLLQEVLNDARFNIRCETLVKI